MIKYKHHLLVCLTLSLSILSGCQTIQKDDLLVLHADAVKAYKEKNWEQAEKLYLILAEQVNKDSEPYFRLGNIYARTSKPDLAIQYYREALVRDPKNAKIWHNIGIVSLRGTTNLYIEMQRHIPVQDPIFNKSVETAEKLMEILGMNKKTNSKE